MTGTGRRTEAARLGLQVRDRRHVQLHADDPLRIARLTVRPDTRPELFRASTLRQGAPLGPLRAGPVTKARRGYRRVIVLLGRCTTGPSPPHSGA